MGTILLCWILAAVFCAVIAVSKGRSGFGWFVLGFLFGPFALLGAIGVPKIERGPDMASYAHCPVCREMIRRDATKCHYCGEAVKPTPYDRGSFWAPAAPSDTMNTAFTQSARNANVNRDDKAGAEEAEAMRRLIDKTRRDRMERLERGAY